MSILHHPSHDVMTGYAAGRLSRGMALVVDAHLGACAACRTEVGRYEAVGGALLESLPPAEMAPDALARAMARIETRPPSGPPPRAATSGIDLSAALEGLDLGPRRWLAPGVWMRPVFDEGGRVDTYVLRTGPGCRLPQHGHAGAEYICVLQGGFSDAGGQYGPGDFAEADPAVVHQPVTDDDGECICLISSEGPMRMQGLVTRLLQSFFRL